MTHLMGADGKAHPHHEPIPGVYIPAGQDVKAVMDRLFPAPHFDQLRAAHPAAFTNEETQ
jgi:hypothetical protein